MPAIKNRFMRGLDLFLISGLVFLFGCTPPGPRALLKGEKLIQQGKWEQAVLLLQEATQLLPNNAQAWNHLGMAYHGNHQIELALKCYRTALSFDRNLAATRYNLGCLLLEQNDLAGASEQLTSFTFLQPSTPLGWLKLGTAQMRNRKFDLAEKSFKTALELHANDPEALNNLGLIHLQRKRPQESIAFFNLALEQNPNYGPALLNLGILNQQNSNTRRQALQHFKKYLELQPRPAEWEKVQALASQLESDLNPPPLQ
ncbi:MAG TPA: tetratricopeptide repeat protein, partial [Verrucomicrobiae bacterium]|nr:tetratricopeptide repeat protein [Verrucomicrobiae bacterium]